MSTKAAQEARRARVEHVRREADRARRLRAMVVVGAGLAVVVGLVAAMLLTSRPESSDAAREAPGFSLTDTEGRTVTLEQYRGRNVLLYFSEGAGCQSCLVQMAEIERSADRFAALDLTVLPIVMNSRDQITADMRANGVRTPFLLDDGTVSQAYGTLGKGMHAGLPGHSFVLVDRAGRQRWYGEYPSMWLSPDDLVAEVSRHLTA